MSLAAAQAAAGSQLALHSNRRCATVSGCWRKILHASAEDRRGELAVGSGGWLVRGAAEGRSREGSVIRGFRVLWRGRRSRGHEMAAAGRGVGHGGGVRKGKEDDDEGMVGPEWQELMQGAEEVMSVLSTMADLLEDISLGDSKEQQMAVQMAAAGAVAGRIEGFNRSFMMALDFMIKQSIKDNDSYKRWLLDVLREQLLQQLESRMQPQVQAVGILVTVREKKTRQALLRQAAAGGGEHEGSKGQKLTVPAVKLPLLMAQADDLVRSLEQGEGSSDSKLLARLLLVREEAKEMMGGGYLDPRNDVRKFKSLPEREVRFIASIMALPAGSAQAKEKLEEALGGANSPSSSSSSSSSSLRIRPGLFLDTITKVVREVYNSSTPLTGTNVQQLEWVREETLRILERLAR